MTTVGSLTIDKTTVSVRESESHLTAYCPVCGRRDSEYSILLPLNGAFVFRCHSCLAESFTGIPDPEILKQGYQSFNAGELARQHFSSYVAQATTILFRELRHGGVALPRDGQAAWFLDYGCGGGHFVNAAKNLGFHAVGLEVDAVSVEFGRSRGLDVSLGSLPSSLPSLIGRQFDVVKSMHVLEHVPHPFEVLRALKSLTKPGGLLVISVPDQASFPSLLKKALRVVGIKRSEWGFIQPPIHLHGFRYETFIALARMLDLKILSIDRTSPLDQEVFPTTTGYWDGIQLHRVIYALSRLIGSGGHLTAVFRNFG